jgi:RNA polymerase-binding transcription factor DksA
MAKAAKKAAGQAVAGETRESPFSPEFIEQQKALLLAERARYVKSADALKAEADALANEREPGDVQFDEESGEGDTLAVERERDLALSAQARAAVELIDAALGRIENGTYGICIHSGEPIPQERLEAIPWAAERVEFKAGSFRS